MSKPPKLGFFPDRSTVETTYDVEHDDIPMPSLEGLADVLSTSASGGPPGAAIVNPTMRAAYVDALLDLYKLLEEYRFHVALAHLLVLDIEPKVKSGEAEARAPEDPLVARNGIPDEARALLLGYMREMPSAVQLFADPHVLITGNRRFSTWVAGQLVDSALLRGVSSCDRIATMLWTRTGEPLPRGRTGAEFMPDFSTARMRRLEPFYRDRAEWGALTALLDHVLYVEVRKIRDRFTHTRRMASELHGERLVSRVDTEPTAGVDASLHLALALGFFALVVRPVVELGGALLAEPAAAA